VGQVFWTGRRQGRCRRTGFLDRARQSNLSQDRFFRQGVDRVICRRTGFYPVLKTCPATGYPVYTLSKKPVLRQVTLSSPVYKTCRRLVTLSTPCLKNLSRDRLPCLALSTRPVSGQVTLSTPCLKNLSCDRLPCLTLSQPCRGSKNNTNPCCAAPYSFSPPFMQGKNVRRGRTRQWRVTRG
jgi:hypothetical protein